MLPTLVEEDLGTSIIPLVLVHYDGWIDFEDDSRILLEVHIHRQFGDEVALQLLHLRLQGGHAIL